MAIDRVLRPSAANRTIRARFKSRCNVTGERQHASSTLRSFLERWTSLASGIIPTLNHDSRSKKSGYYYVGEQDMYVPRDEKGKFKSYDSPGEAFTETEEVMKKLIPTHVVFNGKVGALTGKNALTAKVGENVLIVHSQANRDSRPHLIGGHGDYVWETGKFSNAPETGLETWFIRGGSAGAALYKFLQPGIYAYVTHNLIEAADLGATAHFKVEGKWNDDLMTQVKAPAEIPAPNTN
ncbi:copper-containing nitrite reductase [Bradyrhizobium barranii subsp. barranii]